MTNKIGLFIFCMILMAMSAFSQNKKKRLQTIYILKVQFQPDSSFIKGKVEIRYPSDSCFILTKGLKIISIKADGKVVAFQEKTLESNPNSNEIKLDRIYQNCILEFSGQIKPGDFPKTISSLNMVSNNLIELSNYIDWYPRMKKFNPFDYVLDINLPSNFVIITNGLQKKLNTKQKRIITNWEAKSVYGITLLSAPNLKKTEIVSMGNTIEIYYNKLPKTYIDSMKNDLMKSFQLLTEMFGKYNTNNLVRIVYSPRGAGGYARTPLLIVSEKYTLDQRSLPFGYARDFRLNTHEMAHYWSRANSDTPDDWINEGLAEFSAFWVSEKNCGKAFSNLLLSEYKGIVDNTQTRLAIAETPYDSWEREINRYYKPTLLFEETRQKYGEEKLNKFLKALIVQFDISKHASTAILLEVMEKNLGEEARNYFEDALYKKKWGINLSGPGFPYNQSDSLFIGTWSGLISQFGTTNKFVLNLLLKEGKVIPSLDSPDQNVSNIPVSALLLNGNSISFAVGIASAIFKGILDRKTMKLEGTWTQRGADYPLSLTKENITK